MNIVERIETLAREKLDLDDRQFTADTPFAELGVDSLALVEFLFFLEDEFSIRFPQERTDVTTITELAQLIQGLADQPLAVTT